MPQHVLDVVEHPRPGEYAAFVGGVGALGIAVPRFPTGCVCCNASDATHRYAYDVSDGDVVAEPIALPVCRVCNEHGFDSARQASGPGWALFLGFLMLIMPWLFPGELPGSLRAWGMLPGLALFGLGLWLRRRRRRRIERWCCDGHHGDLELWVAGGRLRIATSNTKLADGLRRLNDNVRGG